MWCVSDGETAAVGDDSGHVYVLGVVEPSPDDSQLCLDVISDWQVSLSLTQSVSFGLTHVAVSVFNDEQGLSEIQVLTGFCLFPQQSTKTKRQKTEVCPPGRPRIRDLFGNEVVDFKISNTTFNDDTFAAQPFYSRRLWNLIK